MLKIDKVTKNYGNGKGVFNISFQVPKGKICAVLGHNGCGKTTTFRILLGLLENETGTITYDKENINNNRHVLFGYVPEERSMLRDLTVEEQVTYLAKLKKIDAIEIERGLQYWLEFFKIEQYRNTKIIELSKGNQQKVQMICALIHNPKILIFDEPLNGLDVYNVELFQSLLMKLKKEKRIVLISSHQYFNIEHFCDQVVYLKEGKMIFKGDVNKLKMKNDIRILTVHSKKDILIKEKGVLDYSRLNDYLILKMENKESSYECIQKLMDKGIEDFKLELVSLQDIIKEKTK